MAYTKIVAGVDGSETSLNAVRHAARLAALNSAELVVVFAHDADDDRARAVLEQAEDTASQEGANVRTKVEGGNPAEVLTRIAADEGADLLAVGNKGMTGVSRFLLGSVPNTVSHSAPCDLLIIRTT